MKTLLVLFAISASFVVVNGIICSKDEHCGAPAVHAKCINKRCEYFPIQKAKRTACRVEHDCDDQSTCIDGKCVVNNGSNGACSSDAFCPDGYICVDSKCQVFKRRLVDNDCPEDCQMPACQC